MHRLVPFALAAGWLFVASSAEANERHFTYTYETATLPAGAREIELWTTPRIGREDYFVQFDERLELEVGVTDKLMTAIYLNFSSATADVAPDMRVTEFEFGGVSSEWKYKLSDPAADSIGVALYGEVTGSTDELELEAKLLLDKRIDNFLFAGNVVFEQELEFAPDETESIQEIELDVAATYLFGSGFTAGLELRNVNEIHGEWEHSALFAGPVVGYAADTWWTALTVLPQLPAVHEEADDGDSRVLDEHEKLEARLLFSFHL